MKSDIHPDYRPAVYYDANTGNWLLTDQAGVNRRGPHEPKQPGSAD